MPITLCEETGAGGGDGGVKIKLEKGRCREWKRKILKVKKRMGTDKTRQMGKGNNETREQEGVTWKSDH